MSRKAKANFFKCSIDLGLVSTPEAQTDIKSKLSSQKYLKIVREMKTTLFFTVDISHADIKDALWNDGLFRKLEQLGVPNCVPLFFDD